jgi:hypothetical protein
MFTPLFMKKRCISLLIAILPIGFGTYAQPVVDSFEFDPSRTYDPQRVGSISGAMKNCSYLNKNNNYLQAHQVTINIMNRMTPIARNQSMGSYQYVLRTKTFNGKSLTAAECERIIASDWQSYVIEPLESVQN